MSETEPGGGTTDPETRDEFERWWRTFLAGGELRSGMRANLRLLAWDAWRAGVLWERGGGHERQAEAV